MFSIRRMAATLIVTLAWTLSVSCTDGKLPSKAKTKTNATSKRRAAVRAKFLVSKPAMQKLIASKKYHVSADRKMALPLPKKWETRKNAPGAPLIILSPMDGKNDKFRENVNVTTENIPEGTSSEEYAERAQLTMSIMLTDYKLVESSFLKGTGIQYLTFQHTLAGFKITATTFLFPRGKTMYLVTASALDNTYTRHKKTFEGIARGFKVSK